jgi:hypothetical protein
MREHGRGGSGTTLAGPHHVGAIPTGSARLGFGQQLSSFLTGTNARACSPEKNSPEPCFHRFVVQTSGRPERNGSRELTPPPVYRMIPGIVRKANAAHRTYCVRPYNCFLSLTETLLRTIYARGILYLSPSAEVPVTCMHSLQERDLIGRAAGMNECQGRRGTNASLQDLHHTYISYPGCIPGIRNA